MKKYLLPNTGNYYKANLHCHTTLSDGKHTPEEIRSIYMDNGYSVVAYTDHEFLFDHSDLALENFLPITSYEYGVKDESAPLGCEPVYHLNLYARDPHNTTLVMPCAKRLRFINRHYGRDENLYMDGIEDIAENDQEYSQAFINRFIAAAKEQGFLVCLNHPAWSLQTYQDYKELSGLFAMEICNSACLVAGYPEDDNHVYERMLRGGKRISPVAADDNHRPLLPGHPESACCVGFTMINAESLTYDNIIHSLECGDFYASTGPLFEEVSYEDGKIYVKCSPVRQIRLLNEGRDAPIATAEKGSLITEAVFDVDPTFVGKYVRVDLRDAEGNYADTRGYFHDEFMNA